MIEQATTEYATKAIAAKELAVRNQTRRNYVLLFGVLCGSLLGFAAAAEFPIGKVAIPVGLCAGVVLAGIGNAFAERRSTHRTASCPTCGHSWEIKEGMYVPFSARMPNWHRCPGCNAPMQSKTLRELTSPRE
jgi:hypothetical protein